MSPEFCPFRDWDSASPQLPHESPGRESGTGDPQSGAVQVGRATSATLHTGKHAFDSASLDSWALLSLPRPPDTPGDRAGPWPPCTAGVWEEPVSLPRAGWMHRFGQLQPKCPCGTQEPCLAVPEVGQISDKRWFSCK